MFNAGHTEQNPETGKRSLAEWLRTVKRDLFQSPAQEPASGDAGWYAGLAVAPGVVGAKDAAGFTGQISRLQRVLDTAGEDPAKSREPSHIMVRPNRMSSNGVPPPGTADSSASL